MVDSLSALFMGIDVNSENVTVALLDYKGDIVTQVASGYKIDVVKPGWTEQNPAIWWEALVNACSTLKQRTDLTKVQCIALTGQMHTTVVLDKHGQVLVNALLWNDQRSSSSALELEQMVGTTRIKEITGNIMMPAFTAAKLQWFKINRPEIFHRIGHVLIAKDYLRYCLTGEMAIDVSDASGTGLFAVQQRTWSDELIQAFGFDRSWFPEALDSSSVSGLITKNTAHLLGLKAGTPVIAGAGDNAIASIAAGIFTAKQGLLRIGSAGSVIITTDEPQIFRYNVQSVSSLHNFCHALSNLWYSMGNTLSAELSLHWLYDALAVYSPDEGAWQKLVSEILNVRTTDDWLIFLPYLGGERTPHIDSKARGVFFGLNFRHDIRHMALAVMEGVAFSQRDCLNVLRQVNLNVNHFKMIGEITRHPIWCQILADILDVPLSVPYYQNSAQGAALMAGLAFGMYDYTLIAEHQSTADYYPNAAWKSYYDRIYITYQELYKSVAHLY